MTCTDGVRCVCRVQAPVYVSSPLAPEYVMINGHEGDTRTLRGVLVRAVVALRTGLAANESVQELDAILDR